MRPCLHELVTLNHAPLDYEFPHDLSIYEQGCSVVMKDYIETILTSLVYVLGLMILLEVHK